MVASLRFFLIIAIILAGIGLVIQIIRKPWLKTVTLRGIFSYFISIYLSACFILSVVISFLPSTMLSALTNINPLLLTILFSALCAISISTSLILMNNTREVPPFLAVIGTYTVHIFSFSIIGLLFLIVGSVSITMNIIKPIILALVSIGLLAFIIQQISLILDEMKLKSHMHSELFKRFETYPSHYPHIRKSIVSAWSEMSQDVKYLDMASEYEKLRNRITARFRASKNGVEFFKGQLGKHLHNIEKKDESGMETAIEVIKKLSIYYPKLNNGQINSFKIKRQIMHDLVLACNVLLTEAVNWDEIGAIKTQHWEVLHAFRILKNLLVETMSTADFDVISSAFRMVYTTLLRHHDTINEVLFGEKVLDDISLLEWMQALMMEELHRLKESGDQDWQINLRLISYSSIIRICTGRIDKLLVYLQDIGGDEKLSLRCYKLMEILTEQIHVLSISKSEYHREVSIALYFLIACFSKYRYSKTDPEDSVSIEFWRKLEAQTRLMIKYNIGSSQRKGLDFFTGYVCLLQFLRYNPIPLIPWNVQSYTFIEIESLMDDLTNYFEKYIIYLDPNISESERKFIADNLNQPKWIFFNSPTVTLEMLQIFINQLTDDKATSEMPSYPEFIKENGKGQIDTGPIPNLISKPRDDLRSSQIH